MLIRCARCRAVFSLQDGVAASGTRVRVQCGRCLAVFETTLASKAPPPAPSEPPATAPALALAPEPPPPPPPSAPVPPPPPPEEPPLAPAEALPPAEPQAPVRRTWPLRLLAGITAAVLVIATAIAVSRQFTGLSRDVDAKLEQGRQKLLRDDFRSLDEAVRLFTDAARMAPGEAVPEAERAFALLLQASAHKDLADRIGPPERDEEAKAAARFTQQGGAAAKQALAENAQEPAALRAMALYEAVTGATDQAAAHAASAEEEAPQDPWVLYARAAAARSARAADRSVTLLRQVKDEAPRLLRAQVDLAAVAIDRRDPAAARDLLQRVLRENASHERARRLLALVPATAP